jgi:hypothetical protein
MDRVPCSKCGAEHDLSEIELSFDQPDAYFDIPREERTSRVATNDTATVIDDRTPHTRFFLRGVIVIPVRGETERDGFGWGVWSEVAEEQFERVIELWEGKRQADASPISGRLANEIGSFPGSLGLPVQLRLRGTSKAPEVDIVQRDHPLGMIQRTGALPEDILEWVSPILH